MGSIFQGFVQNETGDIVPAASVLVRDEITSAVIALFSDQALTIGIANPTTSDANGFVQFYAAAGTYRIDATSGALTRTLRHVQLGTSQSHDTGTSADNVLTVTDADARYVDETELDTRLGTVGNLGTMALEDTTSYYTQTAIDAMLGTAAAADVGAGPAELPTNSQLDTRLGTGGNLGTIATQDADAVAIVGGDISGLSTFAVAGTSLLDGVVDIGAASAEAGSINIAGLTLDYKARVTQFAAAAFVELALHRHSTTIEPILLGYRSNTNDATHAAVTASMALLSIYGGGYCAAQYNAFGAVQFLAGATGTISDTSAPGRIDILTGRNGAILPSVTARFDETGAALLGRLANGFSLVASPVASAVNYVEIKGAATTAKLEINALGTDTNISTIIKPKGLGHIHLMTGNVNTGNVGGVRIGADAAGDTVTTATTKQGYMSVPHYNSATEEDILLFGVTANSSNNIFRFGGSASGLNAASRFEFYTAANFNTLVGTMALCLASDQSAIFGTTTTTDGVNKIQCYGSVAAKLGAVSILAGADNGATTITDATSKRGGLGCPHYTNAEESVTMIATQSTVSQNIVDFCGGYSSQNAATLVRFYTAATTTTTTGTEAFRLDSAQNVINKKGTADQSYSRQVPTTGFAITIAAGVKTLLLVPAGTLATGTITMPANPIDGQEIRVSSTEIITALTVAANAGQTISNAPATLAAGNGFGYIYNLANTNWLPLYQ